MKQKTSNLFTLFAFIFPSVLFGQLSIDNVYDEDDWRHNVQIKTYDESEKFEGHLVELKPDHIGFLRINESKATYFHIDNIDVIKVKNKSMKKNVFMGLGIGALVGLVGAAVHKEDGWFDELDRFIIVVGSAGAGALLGTATGFISAKIPIHGQKEKYYKNHAKLKSYLN